MAIEPMGRKNGAGGKRRGGKLLVVLLVMSVSGVASAEVVYGLLPLRNETPDDSGAWVGQGVMLKLQEYLSKDQDAGFVKRNRLEEAADRGRVDPSQPFDDEQAQRLARAAGAICLVWGSYEVRGKTALCKIHVLVGGRRSRDSFRVTGRLYYFNALVRRIAEEVYRVQNIAVPARLRRLWLEEAPLDESYRHYVEALSPKRSHEDRLKSLRAYLEEHSQDLGANLLLAEWARHEKTEEAVEIYRNVLQWAPESGMAHANLAYLLAMRQEHEQSRAHFEAATRCEDQYPQLYLNYGNLLRRLSLDSSAVRMYEKGIDLFPDEASLYFNLALLYDEREFSAAASETYREAYELDRSLRPDLFASRSYLGDRWIPIEKD